MGIRLSDLPPKVRAALAAKVAPASKPRRGALNKTEALYLARLQGMLRAGELAWIGEHESLALTIAHGAKKATYRPDFVVMLPGGRIEAHEVKGFWREAARLRIKVAAGMYPWRFVGVTRERGQWKFEEFSEEK